jgi:pimeloyl-ACP methyl ester carboxylesterase
MPSKPDIIRIDPRDPHVVAAEDAERRLFEHYRLDARVRYIELVDPCMRIRVSEIGTGAPVLVVPGGSGDAWQFAPLMAELKGLRLIAINRPGGGMSDAVDHRQVDLRRFAVRALLAVMDAFGLGRAPLICNSMGGLWGFWLALYAPERVSKLVQLGCPALVLDTSAPFFMRLLTVPGIGRLVASGLQPRRPDQGLDGLRFQGSRQEALDALPPVLGDAAYAFFHLPTYRTTWRTLSAATMTLSGARPAYQLSDDQLRRVAQPTQFIWGDNDPFGDLDVARQVAGLVPHALLHETTAGHLPHVDRPAECAGVIQAFLDGLREHVTQQSSR